jgi:pimeloyl-ACP methyl ester carboxylesterase
MWTPPRRMVPLSSCCTAGLTTFTATPTVAPLLATQGYRVIIPYLRGSGTTHFPSEETFRNGEQAALALDVIALMDALEIESSILAGFDWGARTADVIAALWPERCKGLVAVSGYLIGSQEAGKLPAAASG